MRLGVQRFLLFLCSVVAAFGGRIANSGSSAGGDANHATSAHLFSPQAIVFPMMALFNRAEVKLPRGPASTRGPAPPRAGVLSRRIPLHPKPGMSLVGKRYPWDLVVQERLSADGNVWRALLTMPNESGQLVAVKLCRRMGRRAQLRANRKKRQGERSWNALSNNVYTRDQSMRQAVIMEGLSRSGPFVKFYGYWEKQDCILLVMELMEGDMQRMVIDQPFEVVDLYMRLVLMVDLLAGLRRMAGRGVVHRDISPENILLERVDKENGPRVLRLKIADFTHACSLPGGYEPLCLKGLEKHVLVGDGAHRAPEAWKHKWTLRSDTYSAGVILYQMLFEGALPQARPLVPGQGRQREGRRRTTRERPQALERFCQHGYDLKKDRAFVKAKALAKAAKDIEFMKLLSVLERMLEPDERRRISDAEASTKLGTLAIKSRRTQQFLRIAMGKAG
mmetsp:Transcript_115589/g.331858  ORF Transcript_115589/g.331858 Transcript_115589/m.331858 type:complete len:449 (-) Transcript_115589:290-1636(-)